MWSGDLTAVQAAAFRFGVALAIIGTWVLGYMVLKAKNLLNQPLLIVLVLVSMGLAYVWWALLGFIPLAYLTTRAVAAMKK